LEEKKYKHEPTFYLAWGIVFVVLTTMSILGSFSSFSNPDNQDIFFIIGYCLGVLIWGLPAYLFFRNYKGALKQQVDKEKQQ
jgi:Na+-driven multidrug efflux pump